MSEPRTAAPEVSVDDLARALDAGAVLLDVREPDEYAEAHVPGAVLVPLGQLGDRLAEVPAAPAGQPLYVICHSGGRSLAAATAFVHQVGVDAVSVAGGTAAWVQSGRPYEQGVAG